jgi:hypothetical protein
MSRILVQNITVVASLILATPSCWVVDAILASMGLNKKEPVLILYTATPTPEEGSKPITAKEVQAPIPTTTNTVTPTTTQTLVPTITQTVTSTSTLVPVCLVPLGPADATGFDAFGKISFSWTSNVDAASYQVVITAPNGVVMTFLTNMSEYSRYVESFPWAGEYSWQVVALDANGKELCRSISRTFTKPVTEPSQTAVPRGRPKATPTYFYGT